LFHNFVLDERRSGFVTDYVVEAGHLSIPPSDLRRSIDRSFEGSLWGVHQ
jgi:hypothetical protein